MVERRQVVLPRAALAKFLEAFAKEQTQIRPAAMLPWPTSHQRRLRDNPSQQSRDFYPARDYRVAMSRELPPCE